MTSDTIRWTTRSSCRACGGPLADALDFGAHPLPDFTQRSAEAARAVPHAPLVLAECGTCHLMQLRHTVDRATLFGPTYPYQSGVNDTMRDHLRALTVAVAARVTLKRGDVAVDIGCNDGSLLSLWPRGVYACGFEPSLRLAKLCWERDLPVINDFFDGETLERWMEAKGRTGAKVVTSIAMFYDVDDPLAFCRDVADCLAPDGIWANEFNYAPTMIDRAAFDMVGHEHLVYYRLRDITALYAKAGLSVFDVEMNAMNGGSLRVWAQRSGGALPTQESVKDVQDHERAGREVEWLRRRVLWNRGATVRFLDKCKRDGKRVWLYGASTRGLTILHHYSIDERLVDGCADRNPVKYGCYIPGTGIPIVSEDEARPQADFFLVLPYTYMDEFVRREFDWLRQGGAFVQPLPSLRLVRAQ